MMETTIGREVDDQYHIPHPLGWRSTYFPRGILSAHSTTQPWYVVVT